MNCWQQNTMQYLRRDFRSVTSTEYSDLMNDNADYGNGDKENDHKCWLTSTRDTAVTISGNRWKKSQGHELII